MRWAVWQLGFCRQLRRHPPVFVFQMGKVSSRSVSEPLQVIYRGAVIHDHVFEGDRMQGETRELKKYLNGPNPPEKLYIISLVREPIVRNISTFFANFERYTGAKCESSSYDIPALKQLFLQNFPHRQPLEWFDERMKRYFDIDVYSKPFPECGYARYERGPCSLLVFRMEIDDEVKNREIGSFLGIPEFRVTRANPTEGKVCGELYSAFKKQVQFSPDFVNMFCESRYFRHFYSADFIEKTRARWTE